ncbi:flap endonuclease Xni [Pseudoalteromonas ruthenica]|uniref:flap endonuclease Xni n=1 Tax=Pseudoalteromonas ruthenica TaxID=151081 RepID=UPI00110B5416|nr:flap endonuclease Xni [Pseudoalteromonas ruthenica]TMO47714.1 flap endonuclease Xni [Pseudoalteromonas ruthenica]TMO52615.1 flap endonuclease Xni [Pseudoalteromonas ruthenica]
MMHFLLIDALNLIRRIYAVCESQHGSDSDAAIEAALQRTRNAINKLMHQYQPHYAVAAFDGQSSWRHAYYPDYKISRKPMPQRLKTNLGRFAHAFHAAQISSLSVDNEEADDVLATLASKAPQTMQCIIVSTDKGYLPLLSEQIKVYDYFGKSFRDAQQVQDKYGVSVAQLTQYFALVGDKTNDIPGVNGIGIKSAKALLTQYDSVQHALAQAPENKIQRQLTDNLPQYVRALHLVSLRCDIDLGVSLKQFRVHNGAQQIVLPPHSASQSSAKPGILS